MNSLAVGEEHRRISEEERRQGNKPVGLTLLTLLLPVRFLELELPSDRLLHQSLLIDRFERRVTTEKNEGDDSDRPVFH